MSDPQSELPDSVQQLIYEFLHSVEELEILLLVRSQAERPWRIAEVASGLRISNSLAQIALETLVKKGLCARGSEPSSVVFSAGGGKHANAIAELAELYERQRIEVLVFISRAAIGRVRSDALHTFAEAFRISRRKKDG